MLPFERAAWNRLTHSVNHDGCVRRRATKEVSPVGIGCITIGSRINQIRLSKGGALNAQKVRVSMSATDGAAKGAHIDDQMVGAFVPSATHDRVACVWKE